MEKFKYLTAGICAFNVKNDPVIRGFSMLGGKSRSKSFEGYSMICRQLLTSGQTLSDYLHDMLKYSSSDFIAACAAAPTELQLNAVKCDVEAIRKLAVYSGKKLKAELCGLYDVAEFMALPDFEAGSFDYTAEYFLTSAAKNGCGIYAKNKAFRFEKGEIVPVEQPDPIRLSELKRYEVQRRQVVENTQCFLCGYPANNVLLYGDRGTGKSSTVKAILNEFEGLRMLELSKNDVAELPTIFGILKKQPLNFIILIDDLVFAENDDRFGALKAALEGSLAAKPDNVLIYATTNRRKIVKETDTERDISSADAIDESMSLADRFGLFVTFGKPGKEEYLDIVRQIAADRGIDIPEERLAACAERFALKRGGRSPRIARQFIEWLSGRIQMGLDY